MKKVYFILIIITLITSCKCRDVDSNDCGDPTSPVYTINVTNSLGENLFTPPNQIYDIADLEVFGIDRFEVPVELEISSFSNDGAIEIIDEFSHTIILKYNEEESDTLNIEYFTKEKFNECCPAPTGYNVLYQNNIVCADCGVGIKTINIVK